MKTLIVLIIAVMILATGCSFSRTSLENPRKITRYSFVSIEGYTFYRMPHGGYAPTPHAFKRCIIEAHDEIEKRDRAATTSAEKYPDLCKGP